MSGPLETWKFKMVKSSWKWGQSFVLVYAAIFLNLRYPPSLFGRQNPLLYTIAKIQMVWLSQKWCQSFVLAGDFFPLHYSQAPTPRRQKPLVNIQNGPIGVKMVSIVCGLLYYFFRLCYSPSPPKWQKSFLNIRKIQNGTIEAKLVSVVRALFVLVCSGSFFVWATSLCVCVCVCVCVCARARAMCQ